MLTILYISPTHGRFRIGRARCEVGVYTAVARWRARSLGPAVIRPALRWSPCTKLVPKAERSLDDHRFFCYTCVMNRRPYAQHAGVRSDPAWRWCNAGTLQGSQVGTGTSSIPEAHEPPPVAQRVASSARVRSAGQRENLERQIGRLRDACAANGSPTARTGRDRASGVHDPRPNRLAVRDDPTSTSLVVAPTDRLTRFGCAALDTLLRQHGRQIAVIHPSEAEWADLLADLTSIMDAFAARLYGQRVAARTTERLLADVQSPTA